MVSFDRGIDGSISGGISGRIDRWEVMGQQVIVDVSAFGDEGQTRVHPGKRMFLVRGGGHTTGGTSVSSQIRIMGTAFVTLYAGTVKRHEGTIVYNGASHESNYKTGDTGITFSGVFDGDPDPV